MIMQGYYTIKIPYYDFIPKIMFHFLFTHIGRKQGD